MTVATEIYIEGVNGTPCGTSRIQMYAGAESANILNLRKHVLVYLKGNKAQKDLRKTILKDMSI